MFDNSTGIIQECYLSMIVVTLIIHVCSLMNVPAGTNALYENAAAAFSHYHSCENAHSPADIHANVNDNASLIHGAT